MPSASATSPRAGWIFLAGAVVVCLLAITTRSLWIDEIETARVAGQATIPAAWQQLWDIHGSDLQMPLYVAWMWACAQFIGTGELALRAVNALWFVPGVLVFALAFRSRVALTMVFLLAAGSPLLWYYLNEARSYSMQAGASLLVFGVILHWWQNPLARVRREWPRAVVLALALVVLGGSSMLSMILAATPLLAALVLLAGPRLREFLRAFWPLWLTVLGGWLVLGIYYLWTLHHGARATVLAEMGWQNVVFIAYELLGFDGLGPGRLELRDAGPAALKSHAVALLGFAFIVAAVAAVGLRDLWRRLGAGKFSVLALAAGLPAGFIVAMGMVLRFRVVGRHLVALSPVVFLILAAGALAAWRGGRAGKILVLLFFTGWLASSFSLRLAARHEMDDYRAAAAIANANLAAGRTVWWNALINGAIHYRVPLDATRAGCARALLNPERPTLAAAATPDVIIASRPDVFDMTGTLAEYLAQSHYRAVSNLPAFTIWERRPEKPAVAP